MNKQELINYCLKYADTFEDYPFDDKWTCIRHISNKKTFAFIYERNNKICINLKCDPIKADFYRNVFENVTPGYHMNKIHWNTILLNGDVPDVELFDMINHSFELTKPIISK